MNIPNDPAILLSYVNTMLRDNFNSLDELCRSLDVDRNELEKKLSAIGYVYSPELNRFR